MSDRHDIFMLSKKLEYAAADTERLMEMINTMSARLEAVEKRLIEIEKAILPF
jgi:ribonuclease D